MLFGAKVIKICVDCKPWGYTVDEMKLFVSEAAKGGLKVAGHVQTPEGATRAIEAGIWSIEHGMALTEEHHKAMAKKGIFLASTDTPFTPYHGTKEGDGEERGAAEERVEERREGHVLDRHGLLDDRQPDDPRRAHDRLPPDLEGRGHPGAGHPEGDDDDRLRGARRSRRSAARSSPASPRTSSRCTATRSRTSTRCATCGS